MRIPRFVRALGLVGSVFWMSDAAFAQNAIPASNGEGIDTHLFRPSLDSKGFFSTNGTDILGKNDISFGLVLDYGYRLLRLPDLGQQRTQLIDHSFQGTFQFNYGVGNLLTVGATLPLNLMVGEAPVAGSGPVIPAASWTPASLDSQTIGYIALHSKLRLLRVEKGLGLALAMQVGVPLTDAPRNAGADPGFWYWPQLLAEKRFGRTGRFRIGLNGGFRGHAVSSTALELVNGRVEDGNRLTYHGAISYRLVDVLDVVADTYGTYLLGNASAAVKPSNEVLGGLKLFVERNSYLMLGAGPRYTNGFEAADVRAVIGFVFEPSLGDRDGDGVKDDVDKCPDEPEDIDGFEDEDGCPDPDNDKDGIPDIRDRCPDEPEDFDGIEDDDGCPEGEDGDRDGDGIPDSRDKCPDSPEDRDGFEDEDGCPDPDNDKDGIPDVRDRCNDPEDKDGFEDEDGCPDPDNDKDGIPDAMDKCPNEPETFNGFEDEDGCPDKGSVIIQDNDIIILEKIQFMTGSAEILPASNKILDAVATTILHHPEFELIEIAGHADERASDAFNLRLTQARVDSVRTALLQRGLQASRLRTKGYGDFCPEDPGHNEAAWEKNRRVEFKIVKTKDGPTRVQLGCAAATKKGVRPDPVP